MNLVTLLDLDGTKNNNVYEGSVNASGTVKRTSRYSLWKGARSSAYVKERLNGTVENWWTGSAQIAYSAANADRIYNVSTGGNFDTGYHANAFTGTSTATRGIAACIYII